MFHVWGNRASIWCQLRKTRNETLSARQTRSEQCLPPSFATTFKSIVNRPGTVDVKQAESHSAAALGPLWQEHLPILTSRRRQHSTRFHRHLVRFFCTVTRDTYRSWTCNGCMRHFHCIFVWQSVNQSVSQPVCMFVCLSVSISSHAVHTYTYTGSYMRTYIRALLHPYIHTTD